MALKVSTISSICLYCKTNSDSNSAKECHEIFNDVGLELQLPSLVQKFFNIKVKNESRKYLCDDCVNHLIELYDQAEHAKEVCRKDDDLSIEGVDSGLHNETWTLSKDQAEHQNNLNKTDTKNLNAESLGSQNGTIEVIKANTGIPKNAGFVGEAKETSFVQENIPGDNGIGVYKNFPEVLVIPDENSSQDTNTTLTEQQDCNENIELIADEDDKHMDEQVVKGNTESLISEDEQMFVDENELNNFVSKDIDENSFVADNLSEDSDVAEEFNSSQPEDNNESLDADDILMEEIEEMFYDDGNEDNEYTKKTDSEKGNENIKSITPTEDIEHMQGAATESLNSSESFNAVEKQIVFDEVIICDQNEVSNDTIFLDEEYLIEETTCGDEYDNIDLNDYLDQVLLTNFQDLTLKWDTQCKLCRENYSTFEELITHSCIKELEEEQQFCCIIKNCEENVNSLPNLARHLILKHCNQLESLKIYGKCPDCQKNFSNILDFNKHSCCRDIKKKTGSPNYCKHCDMGFQSLKRYVFHMQFHLTHRRPKMCLLCGDLFNNSNDFFEHTQYEHMPKSAMACIKCDRFFKEKEVFDSHMELHEESKYQFACPLCPKKYTNKFGLSLHTDIYHNNKCNALKCDHCEKEFVNKASYSNHLKSHSKDVQVESFICSTCGIISNKLDFIKHHVESDENSICFTSPIEEKTLGLGYTCENCSLDFFSIKQLKEHRLSKDHSDDLYHCAICRQIFKTLRHMRNHLTNHKNFKEWQASYPITRYFVCNIGDCQEFYPIWTTLYYHKKRPHKTKEDKNAPNEFKCQFCEQMCSSKMSLAVHVARSHNNSNVICPHCKKSLKTQKHLDEHIDKYHVPVECDICLKKFKHSCNLESHIKTVHLHVKRYFCSHCPKGYYNNSERNIHEQKVHSDISYKCTECNFETNYQKSFDVHMDKHNNRLKFKCVICEKAFGRKQLLQYHLKKHINKKDFSCAKYVRDGGCKASFMTYNLLKKHIQNKHPNSSYNQTLQKEQEFKKVSNNKPFAVFEIENVSFEIMNSNDSSNNTAQEEEDATKTAGILQMENLDIDREAVELILEDEAQFDEQ